MKRSLIKANLDDSHMNENPKSHYPDDRRIRLERRWRRREAANVSLKHNCFASAARTTTKIYGNRAVLKRKNDHTTYDDKDEACKNKLGTFVRDHDEDYISYLVTYNPDIEIDSANDHNGNDEFDEDYRSFLDTYNLDIEIDNASNRNGSDETDEDYRTFLVTYNPDVEIVSAIDHNHKGNGEIDEDYRSFLVTYNPDIEIDCASDHNGNDERDEDYTYNPDIEIDSASDHNGNDEIDEDYRSYLVTYNPDVEIDSACNHNGGSNIEADFCNSDSEERDGDSQYILNQNVSGDNSDDVDVDADYQSFLNSLKDGDRLVNLGSVSRRKSSSVRRNSCVSDQTFHTPEVHCDVDADYGLFLGLPSTVDGDTTNTFKVEDESNSSDSDLIILESNQIGENTPFVCSKTYDSSCFGKEMGSRGNMQTSAYDHSKFRSRLMECLDKPYDQEEYETKLHNVHAQMPKERHLETRQGVVKLYCIEGFNESYLQMYPDFEKAIAEYKEPHKVLFLLRGFFFYVQNVCHQGGTFQPWLDESCLEILRKM
ncbi:uncharacterized protein [Cicer arietinum]|uniref:Dentin sialophosphoprotein-like n=1 Tax=Cicer arietinum TaxID=3827 RepID=A0A1S3E4F1_CICAR|nr:dentin sialophosphoprotein-like [Cicer arietinum]XP_012570640.1 dentin sialophosphoprotein-like [Cicer arietinum]